MESVCCRASRSVCRLVRPYCRERGPPVRVGQVDPPAPPGYAEVTPERYPDYFGGVAYDAAVFNRAGLVRLFVPAEDLPLLDRQEYEALRRNVQVALPGLSWPEEGQKPEAPYSLEDERKAVKELRENLRTGKAPDGLAEGPPSDAAVAAWLKNFPSGSDNTRGALLFAELTPGENHILILGLPPSATPVSFGLFPNRPVASAMVFRIVEDRLVLFSFNRACAAPEDVRALRDEAAAYMRGHARDLRLAPAGGNSTLESILAVAKLPQQLVIDGLLRRNKPEQALAAGRLLLEDCRKLWGDKSPLTLTYRMIVAFILHRNGRHAEAAAEFERYLADIWAGDPPPVEQRAAVLNGLGRSRLALMEYAPAGEALQQSLDFLAANGQGESLAAVSARLDLASARAGLDDVAGALACYRQALPMAIVLDYSRSSADYDSFFAALAGFYDRADQCETAFFYLRLALDSNSRSGASPTWTMFLELWMNLRGRKPEVDAIREAMAAGIPDAAAVGLPDSERALFLSFREALQAVDREKAGKTGPARTGSPAKIQALSRLMEEVEKRTETMAAQKP